jgi:hypothetical protein
MRKVITRGGSEERVSKNSILSVAVAQSGTRNTIDNNGMLRVEHKIIDVLHKHKLGGGNIGWKAPRVNAASRKANRMPWSDEETAWQPAHGQRCVDAQLHVSSHDSTV